MPRSKTTAKAETTRYTTSCRVRKQAEAEAQPIHPLDPAGLAVLREGTCATTDELSQAVREYGSTRLGRIFLGDSLNLLRGRIADSSVDLIMTSPPFGLVRKKDYGNVDANEYVEWFRQFGHEFRRVLKDSGSLVIDIGGAWIAGQPTRSLYHYELLLMLCKEVGFHLAQEFFWWNPARLPTPAEWVTVRRIRVKDAVNCVWWLSKTPWPKASNRRVLVPYSEAMQTLLKFGYKA
jgi:site-specific DNA-methyltransferase (cytosine-N4-specific)